MANDYGFEVDKTFARQHADASHLAYETPEPAGVAHDRRDADMSERLNTIRDQLKACLDELAELIVSGKR